MGRNNINPSETPPLLSANEYKKRFEGALSSIHKSLLVLLGLLAFWFAMENSFSRFAELSDQNHELQFTTDLIKKIFRSKTETIKKLEYRLQATNGENERVDNAREDKSYSGMQPPYTPIRQERLKRYVEEKRRQLDEAREKRKEIIKIIDELRKESVNLSVIGTTLPSRLCYAPTIWLLTLLCWLLYFNTRRETAHRNLAAFYLTLPERNRSLGVAGEGSIWTAPLPKTVQLHQGQNNSAIISNSQLSWLLDWTPQTQSRYRVILFLLAFTILLIVLRITFIALAMTGDFAIEEKVTPRTWRFLGTIIPICLALFCSVQLLRLPSLSKDSEQPQVFFLGSRREFLGGLCSLTIAVAVWWHKDTLLKAAEFNVPDPNVTNKYNTRIFNTPRYLTAKIKAKRRENYQVWISVAQRGTLLQNTQTTKDRSSAVKRSVTLHFADDAGKVRLFSAANSKYPPLAKTKTWTAKSSAATSTANEGGIEYKLNPERTWVWEAQALNLIEKNEIEDACNYLLIGAKLTLRNSEMRSLNFRLFDLLAGLAVRKNYTKEFLEPLTSLIQVHINEIKKTVRKKENTEIQNQESKRGLTPSQKRTVTQLESRLEAWQSTSSNWHRRWSNKKYSIQWHQPMETQVLKYSGVDRAKRSSQKKQDVHQRPIKIT